MGGIGEGVGCGGGMVTTRSSDELLLLVDRSEFVSACSGELRRRPAVSEQSLLIISRHRLSSVCSLKSGCLVVLRLFRCGGLDGPSKRNRNFWRYTSGTAAFTCCHSLQHFVIWVTLWRDT